MTKQHSFKYEELIDCANGKLFGPGNAKLPSPPMLMFHKITNVQENKGKFNKGIIQAEFDICYEYYEDAPPTEIDCDAGFQDKIFIFVPVVILLALGALSIIKGIRGTWDQDVKPEDMVGPNNSFDSRDEPKDSDDD